MAATVCTNGGGIHTNETNPFLSHPTHYGATSQESGSEARCTRVSSPVTRLATSGSAHSTASGASGSCGRTTMRSPAAVSLVPALDVSDGAALGAYALSAGADA